MAEITNTFENGINLDSNEQNQPKGTARMVYNGTIRQENNQYNISNEDSFDFIVNSDNNTIGETTIDNYNVYFKVNPDESASEIILHNLITDVIDVVYSDATNTILNFRLEYNIKATCKKNVNNDIVIYFVDNFNPDKTAIIDISGSPIINDINELSLGFQEPIIKYDGQVESGRLVIGGYHYAIRYLDSSGNKTTFSELTNEICVLPKNRSQTANNLYINYSTSDTGNGGMGNVPLQTPCVIYDAKYTGAYSYNENTNTVQYANKSIKLNIEHIATNELYPFFQIAYIYYNGITNESIYKVISQFYATPNGTGYSNINVTVSGLEETEDLTLDELTQIQASYTHSKCITQLNSRLIRANVRNIYDSIPDSFYEAIAQNVQVKFGFTGLLNDSGTDGNNYTDYKSNNQLYTNEWSCFYYKGFKRGEVYSLAYRVMFRNGYKTKPFHLPAKYSGSHTISDGSFNYPTLLSNLTGTYYSSDKYKTGSEYIVSGQERIRHHIMPKYETIENAIAGKTSLDNRNNIEGIVGQEINVLGLYFENFDFTALEAAYPLEYKDIIGIQIVRQIRDTPQNKSIYLQGFMQGCSRPIVDINAYYQPVYDKNGVATKFEDDLLSSDFPASLYRRNNEGDFQYPDIGDRIGSFLGSGTYYTRPSGIPNCLTLNPHPFSIYYNRNERLDFALTSIINSTSEKNYYHLISPETDINNIDVPLGQIVAFSRIEFQPYVFKNYYNGDANFNSLVKVLPNFGNTVYTLEQGYYDYAGTDATNIIMLFIGKTKNQSLCAGNIKSGFYVDKQKIYELNEIFPNIIEQQTDLNDAPLLWNPKYFIKNALTPDGYYLLSDTITYNFEYETKNSINIHITDGSSAVNVYTKGNKAECNTVEIHNKINNQYGSIYTADYYPMNTYYLKPTDISTKIVNIGVFDGKLEYTTRTAFITTNKGLIFGGDTFICFYGQSSGGFATTENGDNDETLFMSQYTFMLPLETQINTNYRHRLANGQPYFPNNYNEDKTTDLNKYCWLETSQGYQSRTYNEAYSKTQNIYNVSNNGSLFFQTEGEFKNRIIYSLQSFNGEITDSYRVFLVNNYKDIPSNKGEIWNIFAFQNDLYAHTTQSLWKTLMQQTTGVKSENNDTFVLGVASLFAFPAQEILTKTGNSGGTVDAWGNCLTPYGYFFIDRLQKKYYILANDSINEISETAIYNFLLSNIQLTGISYTNDNPYANSGNGCIATYDTQNKRIVIVERKGAETKDPNNPYDFSEFTLSYSFLNNKFVSFHSYVPNFISGSANNLLIEEFVTATTEFRLSKQLSGTKLEPFVLEYVVNEYPAQEKVFDNLIFNMRNFVGTLLTPNYVNVDTDSITVTTPTENSSEMIIKYDNSFFPTINEKTTILFKWVKNQYQSFVPFNFCNNGDGVTTDNNILFPARFKNKFIKVKLIFKGTNRKLLIDFITTTFRINRR